MIVTITNTTVAGTPTARDLVYEGLPAGGRINAGLTKSFTISSRDSLEQALNAGLRADTLSGLVTYAVTDTDSRYYGLPEGQVVDGQFVASTPIAAATVSYDNEDSGLAADDAQAAVDELAADTESLQAAAIAYDNTESDLTADDMQAAVDEVVERVVALEDAAPVPSSGEFDVTVTTLLLNADVGKVVQISTIEPFTDGSGVEVYDATTKPPVGVLVSVDGLGGGVVRCWGVGPCITALNSDTGLVEAKNGGNVGAAVGGSSAYVGRILTNGGMGQLGTMFITAIATAGLVPAA